MDDRHLDWDGSWNVRDLGGLATRGGGRTRPGAVIRSESLQRLTDRGWAELVDHGVATLVDLRNAEQREAEPQQPPPTVTTVFAPLEQDLDDDPEFAEIAASGRFATPLYYPRFIERWPDRCADAVRSIALAEPGGVVVHCGKGCDRAGLIVMLVLSLVGVPDDEIAQDYELTAQRMSSPRATALGIDDHNHLIDELLDREGVTMREAIMTFLGPLDTEAVLQTGGMTRDELGALHGRLSTNGGTSPT